MFCSSLQHVSTPWQNPYPHHHQLLLMSPATLLSAASPCAKALPELLPALRDAVNAPTQVAQAGLADLNNGLQNLLEDLRGQQGRANEIAQQIAEGPLPEVLQGLNATVANLMGASAGWGMSKLLLGWWQS